MNKAFVSGGRIGRSRILTTSAAALLLLAAPPLATAAGIFFDPAGNVAAPTDVVTLGTAAYGYNWTNTTRVLNGVTFTGTNVTNGAIGANLSLSGLGSGNTTVFTSTTAPFTNLDATYKQILTGSVYGPTNSTGTVTLNSLTSGHQYLLQAWVGDPRSGTTATRTETIGSTGGLNRLLDFNVGDVAGGVGQFATGYFSADAASQAFTLTGSGTSNLPQLNALQLRDVTNLGWWNGASNSWDESTSANFSIDALGTAGTFAAAKAVLPEVVFADTSTFGGAAVGSTTVNIAPGGVTGASATFINTVDYVVNSSDAIGFTGAQRLVVQGTGTVTLNGTHTFTGGTFVNNGKLVLGHATDTLSDSGAVTVSGGILDLGANSDTVGTFTLAGGTFTSTGTLTASTYNLQSGTLAGHLGNTGTVIKNGTGTLTLAAGDNTLPASTALTFGSSSTLNLGATNQTLAGLTVGDSFTAAVTGTGQLTLAPGQDLVVGNATATGTATLNLGGLNAFIFNDPAHRFVITGQSTATNSTSGVVTLAANSTITASAIQLQTISTSSTGGIVDSATLNLGLHTTLYADSITMSTSGRDNSTIQYASAVTNPTLVIRGTDGVSRANLTLGTHTTVYGVSPNINFNVVSNATGGTLDALVGALNIGQYTRGNAQTETATFQMGAGTLDATSISLGALSNNNGNSGALVSTFSVTGGSVKVGAITFGTHTDANGTLTSVLNLNGGATLAAQTISAGTGTATRTLNWNDGTITNYDASSNLTIDSGINVALAATGTHTLNVGSGLSASIAANLVDATAGGTLTKTGNGNLLLSGTNIYSGATNVTGGTLTVTGTLGATDITLTNANFSMQNGAASPLAFASLAQTGGDVTLDLGGAVSDTIAVTGNFATSGGIRLNLYAIPTQASYDLVTYGTLTGTPAITAPNTRFVPVPAYGVAAISVSFAGSAGNLIWTGANGFEWDLNASANWRSGSNPEKFYNLDAVTFADGATSGDITLTANVAPSSVTFTNNTDAFTLMGFNAGISGSTTITKSGTGLVTLGSANSFTGGVTISAGRLRIGDNAALGTGTLVLNGGALSSDSFLDHTVANPVTLNGNATLGDEIDAGLLTFSGPVTLAANSILATASPVTISGIVSGGFTLGKSGAGNLTLSGANTFTGDIAVTGGTLILGNAAALGPSTTGAKVVTVSGGGALDFNGQTPTARTYTLRISGDGGGFGAVVNNSGTGIASNAGILNLELLGDATVGGFGRIDFGFANNVGGLITGNGHTLTKTGPNQIEMRGDASGSPISFVVAQGTLVAENSDTALGGSTGQVTVQNGGTLATFGARTLATPVTLEAGGTLSSLSGTGTWTGALTLKGNATVSTAAGGVTLSGLIGESGGAFGLTKTGGNTLTLSGATNPFSGGIAITGTGLVTAAANGAFGTGPVALNTLGGGSTRIELRGGITVGNDFTLNSTAQTNFLGELYAAGGGTSVVTGAVTVGAAVGNGGHLGAEDSSSSVLRLLGPINSANGAIPNIRVGTVELGNGSGNLTRLDQGQGTVRLVASNGMQPTVWFNMAVSASGTFDLNGYNQTLAQLTRAGTFGATVTNNGATPSRLTIDGSVSHTFSGNLTNGTGGLGLTKQGNSVFTLSSTGNTYTGDTAVNAGTLLVTGSIFGSAVMVNNSGVLGGTGTTGAVTVNVGGTLAPGSGLGTLHTGSLTMTSGSVFSIEINSGGGTSDVAAIAGDLNLAPTNDAVLSIVDLGPIALSSGSFTVMTYTGAWNGGLFTVGGQVIPDYDPVLNPASTSFDVAGNAYRLDYNQAGSVVLVAVPEPGSAALLLGGLGLWAGARRRRRE